MTERTLQSLRFDIPERGEEAWLVSVFFWHAECYFIWDIISIRKCAVYRRKWLEGHRAPPPDNDLEVKAFIQQFSCMIWDLRHWKTPPDHHLNSAIQMTFVMLICVHTGQNTLIRRICNSNDHSNFALWSRVKTLRNSKNFSKGCGSSLTSHIPDLRRGGWGWWRLSDGKSWEAA